METDDASTSKKSQLLIDLHGAKVIRIVMINLMWHIILVRKKDRM